MTNTWEGVTGDGDRLGDGDGRALGIGDVDGVGVGWTCPAGWAHAERRHTDIARAEAFTYQRHYGPKL